MTTQTPIEPRRPTSAPAQGPKIHRVEVYWHAVTYKTVVIYSSLILVIIIAGMFAVKPEWTNAITNKVSSVLGNPEAANTTVTSTQAKFVNLDGRVQVKKVNSVTWVEANYHTPLDKGDLIQTASDGAAGTEYTIKSETLVTVEENNVARDHSNTAVRINVGSVDLATSKFSSPDSSAAVSIEDATAYLKQNSRATVKNDPKENEHEIVVASGSAQVQRGQEKIELTQFEKVSVPSGGGPMQKSPSISNGSPWTARLATRCASAQPTCSRDW